MSKADFAAEIRENIRFFINEFTYDPYAKIVIHREVVDGFPRAKTAFDKHFFKVKDSITRFYDRAKNSGHIKKSIHIPTFIILLNRCVESYLVSHMFTKNFSEISIDPINETEAFAAQVEEIFLRGVLS